MFSWENDKSHIAWRHPIIRTKHEHALYTWSAYVTKLLAIYIYTRIHVILRISQYGYRWSKEEECHEAEELQEKGEREKWASEENRGVLNTELPPDLAGASRTSPNKPAAKNHHHTSNANPWNLTKQYSIYKSPFDPRSFFGRNYDRHLFDPRSFFGPARSGGCFSRSPNIIKKKKTVPLRTIKS